MHQLYFFLSAELLGQQTFDPRDGNVVTAGELPTRPGLAKSWRSDNQLPPKSTKVRSSIPDVFKCLNPYVVTHITNEKEMRKVRSANVNRVEVLFHDDIVVPCDRREFIKYTSRILYTCCIRSRGEHSRIKL